jgi:hypothetical protein
MIGWRGGKRAHAAVAGLAVAAAVLSAASPAAGQSGEPGQSGESGSRLAHGSPAAHRAALGAARTRLTTSAHAGIAVVSARSLAGAPGAELFAGGQRLAAGTPRVPGPATGLAPHTHKLTITAIGRDGLPSDAAVVVANPSVAGGDVHTVTTSKGTGSVALAAGRYLLATGILSPAVNPSNITLIMRLVRVRATRGTHVTLDARAGKLIDVTVNRPVKPGFQTGGVTYQGTQYRFTEGYLGGPGEGYIVPVHGARYSFGTQTTFTGRAGGSAAGYTVAAVSRGGVPANPAYHYRVARLARIRSSYRSLDARSFGGAYWVAADVPVVAVILPSTPLPSTVTDYLSPGLRFFSVLSYGSRRSPASGAQIQSGIQVFTARQRGRQLWNSAAIGPAFTRELAARTGNTLAYTVDGYLTDAAPAALRHDGVDNNVTGRITLRKGGTTIATEKFPRPNQPRPVFSARLPSAPAVYTLTAHARRAVRYARLSTSVTAAWRFRSGHTARKRALPLMAVRFAVPSLNHQNQAAPGSKLAIGVATASNPGVAPLPVAKVRVQASADDGRTWHGATVHRARGHWIADVTSPAGRGFMSLRAEVTDTGGNSVIETITRAYAVAG